MTDTKAPTKLTLWLEIIKGVMPTINQAIVLIATGVAGTMGTQWYLSKGQSTPQPGPRIDVVQTQPSSLMARLKALEDQIEELKKQPPKLPRSPKKQQQG
jgi:hypothetical protein